MQTSSSINRLVDSNKNKKSRLVTPTIRFCLVVDRPSHDRFSEFNYNKLMVKVLRFSKKQIRDLKNSSIANHDSLQKNDKTPEKSITICKNFHSFPLLDHSFKIRKEDVSYLLSGIREKILLSKQLNNENNQNLEDEFTDERQKIENDLKNLNEPSSGESSEIDAKNEREAGHFSSKCKKYSKSKDPCYFESLKYKYKDFSHLGKGYDENDSFIDDSDARDVQVPKDMVLKHGGFYVNKEKIKLQKVKERNKEKNLHNNRSDEDNNMETFQEENFEYNSNNCCSDSDFETDEESSVLSSCDDGDNLRDNNIISKEHTLQTFTSEKLTEFSNPIHNKTNRNPEDELIGSKNKENKVLLQPRQEIINNKKRKNDNQLQESYVIASGSQKNDINSSKFKKVNSKY
jgi:hypothetical protein